ncbi:hypothetical protein [Flavobacterium taihuense]|uniref:DUF695 domain containing protein n=1 Tax=Flavobacterium taihuense TaxID=2857508 RepID=A0ABS6Y259_9FLAO|nr:hypothetical protein [Flavobacterium taihuense]MBW4362696.1 hypothetical protein [Flavobacterium taihuense]MBW4362707.1 hypothetical protein [Flavobacterium taihuense]
MNDKPNWLKILEHYCFVENKTGLTLPFVIGSNVFSNEFEENDISSLLYEIRNNEYKKVILKYCGTIKHFILSVSPDLLSGSQYNKKEYDNLIIIQTNGLSGIDDFEDIITVMNLDYAEKIKNREFSIVDNNWGFYSPKEEEMIKEIFKSN